MLRAEARLPGEGIMKTSKRLLIAAVILTTAGLAQGIRRQ